jgi:hypothetical protein
MMAARHVTALGMVLLLMGLPQGDAAAQQTKDQQKCSNALNKGFSKQAKAQGQALGDCVKHNAKGSLTDPTVAACFANPDKKGKVQKARSKTQADYDKKCVGTSKKDPNSPRLPDFGVTAVGVIDMVATDKELALMTMLFGPNPDAALFTEAGDKDRSKCQQAVVKALRKCQDTTLKEFNKCTKGTLKANGDVSDLEACLSGLASNPGVAKACNEKLGGTVTKKCGDVLNDPNRPVFPGDCDGALDLADCLEAQVKCHSCLGIDAVDDIWADCDLFDDGADNDSCPTTFLGLTGKPIGLRLNRFDDDRWCVGGPDDGEPCTDAIAPFSDCTPPGSCIQDARFAHTWRVGSLTTPLTGVTQNDCGTVDPQSGVAECFSWIENIEGFMINGIGYICFVTDPNCPAGFIDCDGGRPADLWRLADHEIGLCGLGTNDPNFPADDPNDPNTPGIGNAECDWLCDAYCADLDGDFENHIADCEGYCSGGPREDHLCTNDSDCPDSGCAGGEPVVHRNKCHCHCTEVAGNASRPGALMTRTNVALIVEVDGPCDGLDITQIGNPECGFNSSERSNSQILNANLMDPNATISVPEEFGSPTNCNKMAAGDSTNFRLVGHRTFIDTGLGDQETAVIAPLLSRD